MLVKLFSKWTLSKLFYLKKLMIEVLKTYFDIVQKLCVFAVIDYINKMSALMPKLLLTMRKQCQINY